MPHDLAKKWKSRTFAKGTVKFEDDSLGLEIDLTGISAGGVIGAGCTHGAAAITGEAISVTTPSVYVVEFQQSSPTTAFYKGIALRDPATSEFHTIIGVKRVPPTNLSGKSAKALADGQIEATWVATQP